ncbi:hypothetical protein [Actinomadura sp. NTSP31]|uniref:hypothetical protein n=1 Tax=Actinomadura sp. NTSP31 TaxID=1735447 RepID=UPI0035BF18AB
MRRMAVALAAGAAALVATATPALATSYSLYADTSFGYARLDYTYVRDTGHPTGGVWYHAYTENTNVFDDGGDGLGSVVKVTYDTPNATGNWVGIGWTTDGEYSYEPEFNEFGVKNVHFYLCKANGITLSGCVRMTT